MIHVLLTSELPWQRNDTITVVERCPYLGGDRTERLDCNFKNLVNQAFSKPSWKQSKNIFPLEQ